MRTEVLLQPAEGRSEQTVAITRVSRRNPASSTEAVPPLETVTLTESVTLEEPLEIQLEHGPAGNRTHRSVSVTMRTPGHDRELALGFLLTEGVLGDEVEPEDLHIAEPELVDTACGPQPSSGSTRTTGGIVRVTVAPGVPVRTASLERNFYATSSCGICGKASLAALRSVAPPRFRNGLRFDPTLLFQLPERMYRHQRTFRRTGGLHAAALFDAAGHLQRLHEDIGRHNAVDKLVGASFLADNLPLRGSLLLLSGRASFELLQKAVMAGIPAVAAIGAPSSLAIQVAKDFDITLIGFLRDDHFNIYNGADRLKS